MTGENDRCDSRSRHVEAESGAIFAKVDSLLDRRMSELNRDNSFLKFIVAIGQPDMFLKK